MPIMKTKMLIPVVSAAVVLLGLSQPAFGAGDRKQGDSEAPAPRTSESTAKPKRALERGMSAEEIIQTVGKPASIAAIASQEGKAETWTYRRLLDTRVYQSADGQTSVPAFIGMSATGPMIGEAFAPAYRLKHRRTYQVTSLLMFDGKLVVAKQWREADESYAD